MNLKSTAECVMKRGDLAQPRRKDHHSRSTKVDSDPTLHLRMAPVSVWAVDQGVAQIKWADDSTNPVDAIDAV